MPRTAKNEAWEQFGKALKKMNDPGDFPTRFLGVFSDFWVLPGAQKTNQNRFFPQKELRGALDFTIFVATAVFLDLS